MLIKSLLTENKSKPSARRTSDPKYRQRLPLTRKFAPAIYFVEMFLVGAVPLVVVLIAWENVGARTIL